MLDLKKVVDDSGIKWHVFDEGGVYVGELRHSYTAEGWEFTTTSGVAFREHQLFQIWAFCRKLDQDMRADNAVKRVRPADVKVIDEEKRR